MSETTRPLWVGPAAISRFRLFLQSLPTIETRIEETVPRRHRTTTPDPAFIEQVGHIARDVLNIHDEIVVPVDESSRELVEDQIDAAFYGHSQLLASTPSAASILASIATEPTREQWAETASRWLGTVTGRIRSDQPNLSNIQRPAPVPVDYNDLEARTMSQLSEEYRRRLAASEVEEDRQFINDMERYQRESPPLSQAARSAQQEYLRFMQQEQYIERMGLLDPVQEEEEEVEVVSRTATRTTRTRRARTTPTGRATAPAPATNPAIFLWAMASSRAIAGNGPQYEIRLNMDGSVSCNCPGWLHKKKDTPRGCKHTKSIEEEAKEHYARYQRGEELPTEEPEERPRSTRSNKPEAETSHTATFLRRVDF